jgi:hypothetical protein
MSENMASDNREIIASAEGVPELAAEAATEAAADDRTPALVEKFVIRLPNGLRDQIRSLSEQNRRSMNSEIIMVLENHIRQKFMDQMSAVNPDSGFKAGERNTELELSRRLENLPAEKKEALLELLG